MANIYAAKISGFGAHLFAQFPCPAADPLQRLHGGTMLLSVDLCGYHEA